jgi:hypothetical protein
VYHDLLSKFGETAGVPVLLNTSFKIMQYAAFSPPGWMRRRRVAV